MNRTKIDWADYSINPIKGICKTGCPYCYAIRLYERFKWNPEIRFDYPELDKIDKIKIVTDGGYLYPKVFIGSTHDIFGSWVPEEWISSILLKVIQNPKIIFIFLTKNPERYILYKFPPNAWLGYSTTGILYYEWSDVHRDNVKFVSLEPMQSKSYVTLSGNVAKKVNFDWLIVGSETGTRKGKYIPSSEELASTLEFARKAGMKIFVKDSLKDRFGENMTTILKTMPREFPKRKGELI